MRRTARSCWLGLLALAAGGAARAEDAIWIADPAVGPNRIEVSIEIACTGSFVCGLLNGYASTREPALDGMGRATLLPGGTFAIVPDRSLDLEPPVAAWLLAIEDTAFDPIALVGTPTLTNGVLFGTTGGPFAVPGLAFGPQAPTPIASGLETGFRFDLEGLGDPMPDNVAGPGPVDAVADFAMLDGRRFEVRNLFWDIEDQQTTDLNPGTLTVFVTGSVTLNVSGEIVFTLAVGEDALSWTATTDATGVDVVQGDLATLRRSGDLTTSVAACVGQSVGGTTLPEATAPEPGAASWYLARRRTAAGVEGYDVPFGGQLAPRDAAIDASPSACP